MGRKIQLEYLKPEKHHIEDGVALKVSDAKFYKEIWRNKWDDPHKGDRTEVVNVEDAEEEEEKDTPSMPSKPTKDAAQTEKQPKTPAAPTKTTKGMQKGVTNTQQQQAPTPPVTRARNKQRRQSNDQTPSPSQVNKGRKDSRDSTTRSDSESKHDEKPDEKPKRGGEKRKRKDSGRKSSAAKSNEKTKAGIASDDEDDGGVVDIEAVPVELKHKVSGSDTFGEECDNCEELLETAQLNEKRMEKEESSNDMYELAYNLLAARPSFAEWMQWILQYVPKRKFWQHRLVEGTIFCFKDDFRTSCIERFWDQWVTEDVLVPTPAAFATALSISDINRFTVKEALLQHIHSPMVMHIALMILLDDHMWKVMIIRTEKETLIHLGVEEEQHRAKIQEIIDALKVFAAVRQVTIVPLIIWVQNDTQRMQDHRNELVVYVPPAEEGMAADDEEAATDEAMASDNAPEAAGPVVGSL